MMQSTGYRAFLIPDQGSMRVTRPDMSLRSLKKTADKDLSDMLKSANWVEVVFVKDKTAIEQKMVRRIEANA